MKRALFLTFVATPVFLVTSPLFAQNGDHVLIQATNTQVRRACMGAAVRVEATNSQIHLRGDCPSVVVNGSDNTVFIERAQAIEVTGNNDRISYERTADGYRPAVSAYGRNIDVTVGNDVAWADIPEDRQGTRSTYTQTTRTTVMDGAPNPVSDAVRAAVGVPPDFRGITLAVNDQVVSQSCGAGQDVVIAGHNNEISLSGSCRSVRVDGYGNRIRVEELGAVSFVGRHNTVTFDHSRYGEYPSISTESGSDNRAYRSY